MEMELAEVKAKEDEYKEIAWELAIGLKAAWRVIVDLNPPPSNDLKMAESIMNKVLEIEHTWS